MRHEVTARILPFVRSKRLFTPLQGAVGKQIARVDTERVTGRLIEFRLIDHNLPLNMADLVDEIWIIACATKICNHHLLKIK